MCNKNCKDRQACCCHGLKEGQEYDLLIFVFKTSLGRPEINGRRHKHLNAHNKHKDCWQIEKIIPETTERDIDDKIDESNPYYTFNKINDYYIEIKKI